tara:strand:- start:684 stop:1730 length:1047 start_codon:yes stop_codon:yes gene_type:complete
MKFNIFILIITFLLISCDNENQNQSARIKLETRIASPLSNSIIRDTDSIKIEVKSNTEKILKSRLILNLDTFYFNDKISIAANKLEKYGKQKIVVQNELKNKKDETLYKTFYLYPSQKSKELEYEIIKIIPHDKNSYTQGLLIYKDNIIESSGQYGKSFIRKSKLYDNQVINQVDIDDNFFAEGISIYNNKLYMLTWKSNKGLIYDLDSFKKIGEFEYQTEGWGLSTYEDKLLMSDGTEKIYFRDPESFKILNMIEVYDDNGKIENINELEIINGKLFCNVYGEDIILIIDIKTGRVEGKINLENLFTRKNYNNKIDVLNGIAYNKINNSIIVTGKWWPSMYEIKIVN